MTNRRKRNTTKRVKQRPTSNVSVAQIAQQAARMAIKQVNPKLKNSQGMNSVLGNLGMLAGNGISKFFGLGAYKLKQNSLFDSQTGSQIPFMHSTDETIVFRHREYLGDLVSSTGYTTLSFDLNPGLEKTFPYLSTIAANFQEYKFRGLIVEFKSTSSTVVTGANTAMGTVSMVAQYRADASPPASKIQLLNEMWSAEGRPCDSFCLPVECDPKENAMSIQYIRTGELPTNQDQKFYDLAKVTVATQGQQVAGTIIGELWISYEVVLYKPRMHAPGQAIVDNAARYSFTGSTNALPLGTSRTPFIDTIGLTFTSNTIVFPAGLLGTYVFQLAWQSSVVFVIAPAITATNATFTSVNASPNNGTTSDELLYTAIVTITSDTLDDFVTITIGGAGTIPVNIGTVLVAQVASVLI